MSASMTIDTRELNAALAWLRTKSKRTSAEINDKNALKVSHQALKNTQKADPAKIAHTLGVKAMDNTSAKSLKLAGFKRFSKGRVIAGGSDTFAGRIINARLKAKGEPLLFGLASAVAAKKLIKSRQKSVAFIKAGWLGPIQILSAKLGKPAAKSRGGASMRGKPKGSATTSQPGSNPSAMVWNSAKGATKVGADALQRAVNEVAADIRRYGAPEIQRDMNQVSKVKVPVNLNQGIKT